jgi:ribosomal protein S18 acetylase RimI-like enzyme
MQIRCAVRADLPSIEALFADADAYHSARLPDRFRATEGPARPQEHLLALVEGADRAVLLAEDGEGALGFVTVKLQDTPPIPIFVPRRIGVIDTLCVRASARRRGIGRALMAAAETWLREHGAHDVELTVYDANREAVAFYEALGYGLLSRRMSRKL